MIIGFYLEDIKDIQKNITKKLEKFLEKFATNANINDGLFDQNNIHGYKYKNIYSLHILKLLMRTL